MSEFDQQDEEVFSIVHGNPRRRGVTRSVGVIVPYEQAVRFAACEAAQKRGGSWVGGACILIPALAVIAATAAALLSGTAV